MYFSEHKFAAEIDEKWHTDRNQDEENERQTKIEKHSYCKFFHRINPNAEGFDIFFEISKIQNYITQSSEEKIKEENQIKEQKGKMQKNKIFKHMATISKNVYFDVLDDIQ